MNKRKKTLTFSHDVVKNLEASSIIVNNILNSLPKDDVRLIRMPSGDWIYTWELEKTLETLKYLSKDYDNTGSIVYKVEYYE